MKEMKISGANLIALQTGRMLRQTSARIRSNLHSLAGVSQPFNRQNGFMAKLKTQIADAAQRVKTANVATGFLYSTDVALQKQEEVLARMRDLAVSANNAALGSSERESIRLELNSLLAEVNQIAKESSFNQKRLLDGSSERMEWALSAIENSIYEMPNSLQKDLFKLNSGTGLFNEGSSLGLAALDNPTIKNVDLNNDGREDILATDGTNVIWSLNLGDGRFQQAGSRSGGSGSSTDVGDFNGDGNLDLIVSDTFTSVYLGNGDGSFSTTAITASLQRATSGDLDGDGKDELIGINAADSTQVKAFTLNANTFQATGATLQITAPFTFAGSIYAKDFDGDGDKDILFTTTGSGATPSYLAKNDGQGIFGALIESASVSYHFGQFDFADVNKDGFLDLVFNDPSSSARVGFGSASGVFNVQGFDVQGNNQTSRFADINRDGNIDIVSIVESYVSGYDVKILFGNGQGNFQLGATSTNFSDAPTLSGAGFALADFDGDQVIDIAFGTSSTSAKLYKGRAREETRLSDFQLSDAEETNRAIEVIDNALSKVLSSRAQVAIKLSEIETRTNYLIQKQEALGDAVNLTQEDQSLKIAELIADQIRQNAQIAVLTQANIQAQIVMKLLQSL